MSHSSEFQRLQAGARRALRPWPVRVAVGLAALSVAEQLFVPAAWLHMLAWSGPGLGLHVWQPVTQWLVEPVESLLWTCIAAWMLAWILPALHSRYTRRSLAVALIFMMLGASVLRISLGWIGGMDSPVYGWWKLLTGLFALYGLTWPDRKVALWFVVEIEARFIAYGLLAYLVLDLMISASRGGPLASGVANLGVWLGAWVWLRLRRSRRSPASTPSGRTLPFRPVAKPGKPQVWHRAVRREEMCV